MDLCQILCSTSVYTLFVERPENLIGDRQILGCFRAQNRLTTKFRVGDYVNFENMANKIFPVTGYTIEMEPPLLICRWHCVAIRNPVTSYFHNGYTRKSIRALCSCRRLMATDVH